MVTTLEFVGITDDALGDKGLLAVYELHLRPGVDACSASAVRINSAESRHACTIQRVPQKKLMRL